MIRIAKSADLDAEFELVRQQNCHRFIDSAELYTSAPAVGRGLSDNIARGIYTRDELFITSKLSGLPTGNYQAIRARVESILTDLGVDELDLLLVHWPGENNSCRAMAADPASQEFADAMSFSKFAESVGEAWSNMLRLRADGLTKRVGVSNFYRWHMETLLSTTDGTQAQRPFANEIYIDAVNQERDYVRYLQRLDISVMAYRPLAFVANYGMLAEMGDTTCATLQSKADAFGASSLQQLVLGWLLARGISPVTKTQSAQHDAENRAAVQVASAIVAHCRSQEDIHNLLQDCDGSEMAVMCGASDEFATAFRSIAAEAESSLG